ncbi:hypothetical protein [Pseudanabaena sp. FACHB-2040]|uniref:hypothetical protein n=1 Tax=Pseudanabaena sp. FACHB-2040 TaxID=2692859 RepID=UPI0016856F24|nr:hypothetical protein [Pseudanabaena sp. FACHB-2040]MBD2257619.1 hypothetical protein [Pseudanabaena sp. FACHB-2040]
MKQMWFRKAWVGIASLLSFIAIGLSVLVLSNDPQWRWRFHVQPPIPAEATSLKVFHPSNDVERITQFEIDQGAAHRVQQFYRTELPNYGWRYRCTVDTPLAVGAELIDVYERGTTQNPKGQTLQIEIGKQNALGLQGKETSGHKRVIRVDEWLTSLPPYKACSKDSSASKQPNSLS